jgi:hypothetical protein
MAASNWFCGYQTYDMGDIEFNWFLSLENWDSMTTCVEQHHCFFSQISDVAFATPTKH